MKIILFISLLTCWTTAKGQTELLDIDLFSPTTKLALRLYRGSFGLFKRTEKKNICHGKYYFSNDTLFLVTQDNKLFKLKEETFEIYNPINLDTLKSGQKFLAWNIRFPNGKTKQTGGWTKENTKSGVWQYYDSSGLIINKKLFEKGVLVDDNFKFSWEK
jgi:hypothetical protein